MSGRLAAAVIVLGVLLAGCKGESDQSVFQRYVPDADDVQYIRVDTYPPGFALMPLTAQDDGERIEWIVGQLRAGKLRSTAEEAQFLHSDVPALALNSGGRELVRVFPAWNCRRSSEGQTCQRAPRDVGVAFGERVRRVFAPELAAWLAGPIYDDLDQGSEAERETQLAKLAHPVVWPEAPITHVVLGLGGPWRTEVPLPLRASNSVDRRVIEKLRRWLVSAERTTTDAEHIHAGSALTMFAGRDGRLDIAQAWSCSRTPSSLSCIPLTGEVLLIGPGPPGEPFVTAVRSPELAAWLNGGWQQDMKLGPPDEVSRRLEP